MWAMRLLTPAVTSAIRLQTSALVTPRVLTRAHQPGPRLASSPASRLFSRCASLGASPAFSYRSLPSTQTLLTLLRRTITTAMPPKRKAATATAATEPAPETEEGAAAAAGDEAPPSAKKRASPRSKKATPSKAKKTAADAGAAEASPAATAEGAEEGDGDAAAAKPAKKTSGRGKKAAAAAAAAAGGDEAAGEGDGDGAEPSPRKPKRTPKKKKAASDDEGEGEGEGEEEAKPAKKRAKKDPGVQGPRWDESMRKPPPEGPHVKVLSWNVAGLRAVLKKDPEVFSKLLAREKFDILCIQETKLQEKHVEELQGKLGLPADWHASWVCSVDKAGYAGVATFSRVAPLSVEKELKGAKEHHGEGRVLVTEYKDFYMMNTYVPNSGEGLKRLDYRVGPGGWDQALAGYVKDLQKVKPVLMTGDLNCAHQVIDINRPKTNLRSAGFTQEERDSFGKHYLSPESEGGCGLIDLYRTQYPDIIAYTYYSYRFQARAKGIGWRLDYFLASQGLQPRVYDNWLLQDVEGSDHIPLGTTLTGTLD